MNLEKLERPFSASGALVSRNRRPKLRTASEIPADSRQQDRLMHTRGRFGKEHGLLEQNNEETGKEVSGRRYRPTWNDCTVEVPSHEEAEP